MTDEIAALARPTFTVIGCVLPPLFNFGQDSLWHIFLVPFFLWSVMEWFRLYIEIKKRSA